MRKILLPLFFAAAFFTSNSLLAQNAPAKQWDKVFGGNEVEMCYNVQQTTDGGYVVGGVSNSNISGSKSQASKGSNDYWLIKLNSNGIKLWDKTYGGTGYDELFTLQQTADGGYILGGISDSPISGDKSQNSRGFTDFWVIKLDGNGNKIWDKTFGGVSFEYLMSISQTSDGGYLLGGYSKSGVSGEKSEPSKGLNDFWIAKIDANGNKLWDKTLGGNGEEYLNSLKLTSDGGFILGGISTSGISGDKSETQKGGEDYWIVKINSSGNKIWDKTFGGNSHDGCLDLQQTSDGGYILGGSTLSNISGDKSQDSKGLTDFWILKLDGNGNKVWDKTIGGNDEDYFSSVSQTSDGGYILGGGSSSAISGDKSRNAINGTHDYWIIKINATGAKLWDLTLGGTLSDNRCVIKQTSDGGFICSGFSQSDIGWDKSQPKIGTGTFDFWLVKLGPATLGTHEPINSNFKLYPNPTTGMIKLEFEKKQPYQIMVQNALGQQVMDNYKDGFSKESYIQIDLTNQPKGIYTVRIIFENQAITKKIFLQ